MKGTGWKDHLKDLASSRAFIGGFLGTYFLFFILTMKVFEFASDGPARSRVYGFPYEYYVSHCFGGSYSLSGLLGNILFAAILGTIIGVFCAYVWKNVASEDFRKRWNL